MWWCTPLISIWEVQVGKSEAFGANLVYLRSYKTARATWNNPVLLPPHQKKKRDGNDWWYTSICFLIPTQGRQKQACVREF